RLHGGWPRGTAQVSHLQPRAQLLDSVRRGVAVVPRERGAHQPLDPVGGFGRARTVLLPQGDVLRDGEGILAGVQRGGARLGGQVRAPRVRLQSQLVFRQRVAVFSRRVRAVAQLFVI